MQRLLKTLFLVAYVTATSCSNHFHEHLLRQMKLGQDTTSTSLKRVCEIYSKATGRRIQIRGKRVDANGSAGDIHARLEISSVSFGSRITIRSVVNGRYLCMSRRGRLMAKIKRINSRCHFTEKIGENYFDTFRNVRRSKWYLAFHQNGRPKRGSRTSSGQTEVMFLKRPVQKIVAQPSPSISEAKQNALSSFRKKIRMRYLASSKDDNSNIPTQTRMMQDDPRASVDIHIIATDPPEIQKEIDTRRRQALKELIQPINVISASPLAKRSRDKIKHQEMQKRKTKRQRKKRKHKKLPNSFISEVSGIHSTVKQRHKEGEVPSGTESVQSVFQSFSDATVIPTIPFMLQIRRTNSQKNLNSRTTLESFRKKRINNLSPLGGVARKIT